ncbi:MAG: nucleoside-diphosphate kinase [Proteobacteria bacterium]|nr:nucleoside-diphosphate kinase [Pseudomonadota bacterium]
MKQRTLSIVKPDAVRAGNAGKIIAEIEAHFKIVAMRKLQLTHAQAAAFYAVHAGKPFYNDLVDFMTSGPVVVMCLEGEDAITGYRTLMGATNPEKAAEGTLRKKYATSMSHNAVHGSDAPETAAVEVAFFFPGCDLID